MVGTQTRHQGETTLTSAHAKTGQFQRAMRSLRGFFVDYRPTAEQLGWAVLGAEDVESDFRGPTLRKTVGFRRGSLSRPDNQDLQPRPTKNAAFNCRV